MPLDPLGIEAVLALGQLPIEVAPRDGHGDDDSGQVAGEIAGTHPARIARRPATCGASQATEPQKEGVGLGALVASGTAFSSKRTPGMRTSVQPTWIEFGL